MPVREANYLARTFHVMLTVSMADTHTLVSQGRIASRGFRGHSTNMNCKMESIGVNLSRKSTVKHSSPRRRKRKRRKRRRRGRRRRKKSQLVLGTVFL